MLQTSTDCFVRRFISSIFLKIFLSVTHFKSKMIYIWTRHLKTNMRNLSSLSAASKVKYLESKDSIIPSWTWIQVLLSNTFVPRMHVGLLPFLPDLATVFYCFQCYEKLTYLTYWTAKARCTPTFLQWRCF